MTTIRRQFLRQQPHYTACWRVLWVRKSGGEIHNVIVTQWQKPQNHYFDGTSDLCLGCFERADLIDACQPSDLLVDIDSL
jgi:hypothetical protein